MKFKITEKQYEDIIDFAFVLTVCSSLLFALIITMEQAFHG